MRLSIIIPCYNMGRYVNRCLQSIVDENLDDMEVLVVNDGSTDNTVEEFNKFKFGDNGLDRYPYIRIINQENAGASVARNNGIKASTGDYLCFADADDRIESGGLRILLGTASSNSDPDWVLGSFNIVGGNDLPVPHRLPSIACSCTDAPARFYRLFDMGLWGAPWAKLYRRQVIIDNDLWQVPGMVRSQDTEFNLRFLADIRSFATTDRIVYNYWLNSDGAMSRFQGDRLLLAREIYCKTHEDVVRSLFHEESDYDERVSQVANMNSFAWLSTIYVLYRSGTRGKYGWLKKICAAAGKNDPDWLTYFKTGNPGIIRRLMRLGIWAPHMLLTFVAAIPALRRKMRG